MARHTRYKVGQFRPVAFCRVLEEPMEEPHRVSGVSVATVAGAATERHGAPPYKKLADFPLPSRPGVVEVKGGAGTPCGRESFYKME